MAKFEQFLAKPEPLRVDKEAYAAEEQAGRRIGSLYNEAGADYKEIGKLKDEAVRGMDFPFDFDAFKRGGVGRGGGSGFNFKTGGSSGYDTPNHQLVGGSGRSINSGLSGGGGGSPMAKAAQLVDGWGNDISKEAGGNSGVTVMGGDKTYGPQVPSWLSPGIVSKEVANQQDPQFDIPPINAGGPNDQVDPGAQPGAAGNPIGGPAAPGFNNIFPGDWSSSGSAPASSGWSWGGLISDAASAVSSVAAGAASAAQNALPADDNSGAAAGTSGGF